MTTQTGNPLHIVFVSLEQWDDVWRRNQFLCAGLIRQRPDTRILFVAPPLDVPHALRTGSARPLRSRGFWSPDGFPQVTVCQPTKLLPNALPAARRMNETIMRAQVRSACSAVHLDRPLAWLNAHEAAHMAGRLNERGAVYDITDDWTLVRTTPAHHDTVKAQDAQLCRCADLVVVCSDALLESRRHMCRRILLLPNGVDTEHYRRVGRAPERREWSAPVFGYTGTLHAERTDVDLIIATARAFPKGTVALIGPNHLTAADNTRLCAEPNVTMTGAVPYRDVPLWMSQFDVCIVPHVESQFTESLNPIKLWEYLAGGKPIVSTNVAGFREYRSLCHIASGPDQFVAACGAALAESSELPAARQAEACKHSWDSRVDRLLAEFRAMEWL